MGHAGEQLSHRRQLLTLTQSLLRSLSFLSEAAFLQDHRRLIGESRKKRNVIGAEQPPLRCVYIEDTGGLAVRSQRYPEKPVQTDGLGGLLMDWIVTFVVEHIAHSDRLIRRHDRAAQTLADSQAGTKGLRDRRICPGLQHQLVALQ